MTLLQVLLILRARRVLILATLTVTVAVTLGINLLLPKSYKASTSLVMNYKGIDSVTGTTVPAQLMPGYMATQVDILNSKNVAFKVIDLLQLDRDKSLQQEFKATTNGQGHFRDWLAERLLKKLDAVPSRESSVLDVHFSAGNPTFAASVANAFARAYLQTAIQLKEEPLKKASGYFSEQNSILKRNLDSALRKLSQYQQERGIVSADNRLDVESSRLNDLSAQLVVVQGQRMEASSRQQQTRLSHGVDSADIMASPLIQNLEASVSVAEAKLSEVSERLGTNHPLYQAAKADVDERRAQLNLHIQAASNAISGTARILERRETELRNALQSQKDKVLQLNKAREDLSALTREVEGAQRAYDASLQRFNQTSLEGQANQTDVAILNEASVPTRPANPKVLLNVAASVFLGLLLGVLLGFAAELVHRRIRSVEDFAEACGAAVLATFHWPQQPSSVPARRGDAYSSLHAK